MTTTTRDKNMTTYEQKETEFAVFCTENTASRLKKQGKEAFWELMKTRGVEDFLYPSFQTQHTQSKDFIVDEVVNCIGEHNPSFVK